ncbi:MAG: glutamate 5-kinase [Pseudomonadota bacterium]
MASLSQARRLVVKIGSTLLVDGKGLRKAWLRSVARDVVELRARGTEVIVVSSGSIALGRTVLELSPATLSLEQSQAAAAVGQIRLAQAYETALSPYGVPTAQMLLTLEDSQNRRRYLNTRATVEALMSYGAVPIVNENDTIATDEIRYGDNDRLAAQVAVMAGADMLVLLSDVDGFYTADPAAEPSARRYDTITCITSEIEAMAGDAGSGLSKGGMKTKLLAAQIAMNAGCAMAIALGSPPHPLRALERGASCTWFIPATDPRAARKLWIAGMKPRGEIVVDDGAAKALAEGRSLLPAGVTDVRGQFGRGEPVTVLNAAGNALAKGLVRYTAAEAKAIRGYRSGDIEALLGYPGRAALIHRDDMVI